MQVMVEQEHEVLPSVLPLIMFPQGVGGYKVPFFLLVVQCLVRVCLYIT